ncbi:hypothetical protein Xen7305DRAFT_00008090 [Xenococcus sp. PCC 7305]|uniref:hypothetical protein n=1 Tax=Xenococcus sp. PCC 7305 TaxID=102125 RepID=UPI0002AC51C1|nr:hypothetical protein [Xenococcus sp. PCC 7305]ELS01107.1 hypothetical protein Xen7305DRAFT_00008090 [Xenococcus sp. PCC 7305]
MPGKETFKPEGNPLSDRDRQELDKIKAKDVNKAVLEAHPEMKSFLNAEKR